MMASDMKDVFLAPVRAAHELLRCLLRKPYEGAPSSWTLEMTAVLVVLPFIIPVLHLWDAEIVRAASQSNLFVMEILRAITDVIRTQVWLAVALVIWVATVFMLVLASQERLRDMLTRLHGWATLVLVSIVIGSIPLELGKLAVGRARPFLFDEVGSAAFSPFRGEYLYESFPSGHSMMAGIMMASLWIFLPRWRGLSVPVCLLFCVSRLAAGAHYPTDIVAGCVVGFIATLWVARFMATRNIIFSLNQDRAFPSP
ncbi:lipid A 1-phosphatase LpxE [Brucella sp. BE17]|uniref:lipid A 1-phosphatase LpxE n=1 Tax=Brucella sp. BE17 TaxID=3142977 RepID=UPI0031BA927F